MSNLCIVNLPVRLEHTKDDPGEDPGEKIRLILEVCLFTWMPGSPRYDGFLVFVFFFVFYLDARITQIW